METRDINEVESNYELEIDSEYLFNFQLRRHATFAAVLRRTPTRSNALHVSFHNSTIGEISFPSLAAMITDETKVLSLCTLLQRT